MGDQTEIYTALKAKLAKRNKSLTQVKSDDESDDEDWSADTDDVKPEAPEAEVAPAPPPAAALEPEAAPAAAAAVDAVAPSQKFQVGDRVRITGGKYERQEGKITTVSQKSARITLDAGFLTPGNIPFKNMELVENLYD